MLVGTGATPMAQKLVGPREVESVPNALHIGCSQRLSNGLETEQAV